LHILNTLKNNNLKITFEILESEGIENYAEVSQFIKNVKEYSFKIAIDDFGSGYSNFAHILNLDVTI
jgi:EAL domain-containing protein (putative c-di-GMP-specific phosphodiesterase class I)